MQNTYFTQWNRGSSVSTVTELRNGRPGFSSRQGQGFLLFVTASRSALRSAQSHITR